MTLHINFPTELVLFPVDNNFGNPHVDKDFGNPPPDYSNASIVLFLVGKDFGNPSTNNIDALHQFSSGSCPVSCR